MQKRISYWKREKCGWEEDMYVDIKCDVEKIFGTEKCYERRERLYMYKLSSIIFWSEQKNYSSHILCN